MAQVFTLVRLSTDYDPYNGYSTSTRVIGTYSDITKAIEQLNKDFDIAIKDWCFTRDNFESDGNSTRRFCENCYIDETEFHIEDDDGDTVVEKIFKNEFQ